MNYLTPTSNDTCLSTFCRDVNVSWTSTKFFCGVFRSNGVSPFGKYLADFELIFQRIFLILQGSIHVSHRVIHAQVTVVTFAGRLVFVMSSMAFALDSLHSSYWIFLRINSRPTTANERRRKCQINTKCQFQAQASPKKIISIDSHSPI